MFQEWLFFGLLIDFARIFGISIDRTNFLTRVEGQHYACTEGLQEMVEHVTAAQADAHSIKGYPERYLLDHGVLPILDRAFLCLGNCYMSDPPQDIALDCKLIWLSTAILLESLAHIAFDIIVPCDEFGYLFGLRSTADKLLHGTGICPKRLDDADIQTISEIYVAILATKSPSHAHDNCSANICLAEVTSDFTVSWWLLVVQSSSSIGAALRRLAVPIPSQQWFDLPDRFSTYLCIVKSVTAVAIRSTSMTLPERRHGMFWLKAISLLLFSRPDATVT